MPENRRRFIQKFGITLGSLIASGALPGCGAKKDGGLSDTQSQAGKSDEPAPTARAAEWEQLRQCWLNLHHRRHMQYAWADNLEALGQDEDADTATTGMLAKEHQAILNTLVTRGQLKEPVAEHMQMAFEEAALYRGPSGGVCYLPISLEEWPRADLFLQAEALRKMSGALDPATVAKAQAAITRDIALFEVFRARSGSDQALPDDFGAYLAGKLEAGPEELEAARLLTELFMEKPD